MYKLPGPGGGGGLSGVRKAGSSPGCMQHGSLLCPAPKGMQKRGKGAAATVSPQH